MSIAVGGSGAPDTAGGAAPTTPSFIFFMGDVPAFVEAPDVALNAEAAVALASLSGGPRLRSDRCVDCMTPHTAAIT